MPFVDRTDAGRQLAHRLLHLRGAGAVVVAVPRGGVPVADAGRLAVVPGASHLYPEPGALSQVTDLAADWFGRHFAWAGAIAAAA